MSKTKSPFQCLVAAAVVGLGLSAGCGNDLGRTRVSWEAGSPQPKEAGAVREGGSTDAGRDVVAASADALSDQATLSDAKADGEDASDDANADVFADGSLTDARIGDASLSDAAADARNDGGLTGVRATLALRSASCLSCAQFGCPSEIAGCDTVPGRPDGGPDSGLSRPQLCAETLQCLLSTGCEERDNATCYCGPKVVGVPELCSFEGSAEGVCKAQLERSLESVVPKVILSSMVSTDLGGGWALLLSRCLRDNQCTGCFPSADAGSDAGNDR